MNDSTKDAPKIIIDLTQESADGRSSMAIEFASRVEQQRTVSETQIESLSFKKPYIQPLAQPGTGIMAPRSRGPPLYEGLEEELFGKMPSGVSNAFHLYPSLGGSWMDAGE
jgi:hypothetical protein